MKQKVIAVLGCLTLALASAVAGDLLVMDTSGITIGAIVLAFLFFFLA